MPFPRRPVRTATSLILPSPATPLCCSRTHKYKLAKGNFLLHRAATSQLPHLLERPVAAAVAIVLAYLVEQHSHLTWPHNAVATRSCAVSRIASSRDLCLS
jgi:hypothetical protein|mmetsp:Transcript_52116/g.144381  ORF Transcript_52116/g.144381 Transcript_52116/m.144381 type:complete len:101 (-) Transcript_52116:1153-1455(-)